MKTWNTIADDAYRAEIARAEAAKQVADEGAAQQAAREAVLEAIRKTPGAQSELEELTADTAAQRAHKRAVDEGKRRIEEIASGQLCFAEMEALNAVIPLGEGMVSTVGNVNDERVDMADELRKQNLFEIQRKYQEWSDGFRRPVKAALRTMNPGSTVRDAVDQGKL